VSFNGSQNVHYSGTQISPLTIDLKVFTTNTHTIRVKNDRSIGTSMAKKVPPTFSSIRVDAMVIEAVGNEYAHHGSANFTFANCFH